MDATKYGRSMLREVKGLNLRDYPLIRNLQWDLEFMGTVMREAKKSHVKIEFRNTSWDFNDARFDILFGDDVIGTIWAHSTTGQIWYVLATPSRATGIEIWREEDGEDIIIRDRSMRTICHPPFYFNQVKEVQDWVAAVVAQAVTLKTMPARKRLSSLLWR